MKCTAFCLLLMTISTLNLEAQIDAKTSGSYQCYLRKSSMNRLPRCLATRIQSRGIPLMYLNIH